MTTSKISESCVLICLLGLTCVTYVTPFNNSECISPLGMENSTIKDSQITVSSVLNGTTASGRFARLRQNIDRWGAWCPDVGGGSRNGRNFDQYIQIDLLSLTNITGIATQGRELGEGTDYTQDYKMSYSKNNQIWTYHRETDEASNEATIFQGNTDVSTVERHELDPTIMARYIRVDPGYRRGTNACMRLELYGCAVEQTTKNGTEIPTEQSTQPATRLNNTATYTTSKPGCKAKSTNTIVMFLVVLLIVVVVISVIILYKIRRQTRRKLSTSVPQVDTVEMQNETAAEPSQNNQGQDHIVPDDAEACPYEVVQISPPSVYAELDKNRRGERETTDDDTYQKLIKHDSDYVIPAEGHTETYEEVGKEKTPPDYTELDNAKRDQKNKSSYQKLM